MRLPLISLGEWVYMSRWMDDADTNRLYESFMQEFELNDHYNLIYKNNDITLLEKYGTYDGQIKLCKEVADVIANDIEENPEGDTFKYNLNSTDLKARYKNLFFDELDINCDFVCQTGYDIKKSVFNSKTMKFDKIVIYINIKQYNTSKSITIGLTHELTHAWDDFNRHLKPESAQTLEDIHSKWYKNIIVQFNSDSSEEKFVSQLLYTFSNVETNAYISEFTADFQSDINNKKMSYNQALEYFKKTEAWERFIAIKNHFELNILKSERRITSFCNTYNRFNNTNWTETKIIKHVRQIINKTFNKILSVIPKIYYDFISSDENVDEANNNNNNNNFIISQSRLIRLRTYFPVIIN